MKNRKSLPRFQTGVAWWVWAIAAAIVAIAIIALLPQCSGPLTAAGGQKAAGTVHGALTELVEVQGLSSAEIGELLDGIWEDKVAGVRTKKGVTTWVDAFCAQLIELIRSRIQSITNSQQKRVWQEVLRLVTERCATLQDIEEPAGE